MDQHDSIYKMCLLTVESAAGMINVSEGFIATLIKSGKIPFMVIEGEERIRMWDLMNYIEKNLKQYSEVLNEIREITKKESE